METGCRTFKQILESIAVQKWLSLDWATLHEKGRSHRGNLNCSLWYYCVAKEVCFILAVETGKHVELPNSCFEGIPSEGTKEGVISKATSLKGNKKVRFAEKHLEIVDETKPTITPQREGCFPSCVLYSNGPGLRSVLKKTSVKMVAADLKVQEYWVVVFLRFCTFYSEGSELVEIAISMFLRNCCNLCHRLGQ